jgi:ribonuclease E
MLETELNDPENSGTPHHNENSGADQPAGLNGPTGGAGRVPGADGGRGTDGGGAGGGPGAAPSALASGGDAADPGQDAPVRRARRPRRAATRAAGPPPADLAEVPAAGLAAPPAAGSAAPPVAAPPAVGPAAPPAVPVTQPAVAVTQPAMPVTPAAPTGQPGVTAPPVIPQATFQPPAPVIFQPPAPGESAERGRPPAEETGGASESPEEPDRDAAEGTGRRRRRRGRGRGPDGEVDATTAAGSEAADGQVPDQTDAGDAPARSGRSAGGRKDGGKDGGRKRSPEPEADGARAADAAAGADGQPDTAADDDGDGDGTPGSRRRRRRRRRGSGGDADQPSSDDPPNTVVHVRVPRAPAAEEPPVSASDVKAVRGSTRLEAKRQRRREGRESGRRRPPVISESEFLARRESVERVMVVRQQDDRTQIAVLEDGVLVEHYVDKATHQSMVGNVYLGKVQNVLPSMEAAFVDVGKGRNAVLYAGEVNFDASGLEGDSKRIESALKSGQSVLVQVTKDPVGHKGARLTSQVSLPGRYLVYVPGGSMMGISRKLPDKERTRLKQILKQVMPDGAGVIVRTAAEGATEEELSRDVARLSAQWEAIDRKSKTASAPELLYSEPDLTIRVVRDIFNEDFASLVVAGDEGWDLVHEYVRYVAPHLAERVSHWTDGEDVFAQYRIDEQLAKALERKVWLPSGGSLVIDNTEAMTVVDVNTGKFTGQGGNLEETVTRNNLEAAEEIVRQLRLRDVGGIIVIDFIDMVLESNRELVLRRMLECLARDRTKHQVAEVTSLGLVQMTRKRVGSGLLEAFSEPCDCCNGRGRIISLDLTDPGSAQRGRTGGEDGRQPGGRGDNGRGDNGRGDNGRGERNGRQDRSGRAEHNGRSDRNGQQDRRGQSGSNGQPSGNGQPAEDAPAGTERAERTGGRRRRRSGSSGPAAAPAETAQIEDQTAQAGPDDQSSPAVEAGPDGQLSPAVDAGRDDRLSPAVEAGPGYRPSPADPAVAGALLPVPDDPAPGDHQPPPSPAPPDAPDQDAAPTPTSDESAPGF